jgi:hypothetical protein
MFLQILMNPSALAARLLKGLFMGACLLAVLALLSPSAFASQVVGEVTLTIGKSKIERSSGEAEPQKGSSVQEGDIIRTTDNGHVHVRFIDGARVSVRPNSVFRIHEFKYSPADPAASVVRLSLDSGEARSISGAAAHAEQHLAALQLVRAQRALALAARPLPLLQRLARGQVAGAAALQRQL